MKKKFLLGALSALSCLVLSVGFAACGGDDGDGEKECTHVFTNYVSNGDATCAEDGTKTAECDNGCGKTDTVADEGSALGCSFTEYKSDNNATCAKDGTKTAACDNGCGKTDTVIDEDSALGHTYEDGACLGCGKAEPSEGLEFVKSSDEKSYSVKGIGTCQDTEIVIPDEYEGLPVISIEDSAFKGRTNLTSVVVGDNITLIGRYAFQDCTGLSKAVVSDSVTVINTCAFYNCTGLKEVEIPEGVISIGYSAFKACANLTGVEIPDSITSIGEYAFYNCTSLTEIQYNATKCSDFESNNYVFYNAGKNGVGMKITIGANVEKIPASMFHPYINGDRYEHRIISVEFEENSVCKSVGGYAFYNAVNLSSVVIPDSVTTIETSAFIYCTGLTSVSIGNGVASIGGMAFYGCTNLKSIEIPDSVISIGDSIFNGCTSLQYNEKDGLQYLGNKGNPYLYLAGVTSKDVTDVVIDENCRFIASGLFYECASLMSVVISDSVTSIGSSAFYNCTNLASVTIGDSVTSIGLSAFNGCTSLTGVEIPDSVTSISSSAFKGCTNLTSVTIGDGVSTIGTSAFEDTGYYNEESNWEDGVLYIGKYLIKAKSTIAGEYKIKEGTLYIADAAFYYCSKLTGVVIPDSVISIEEYAFGYCYGLTNIVIPDSVISIGGMAFYNCTNLKSVEISDNVTLIGDGAFMNCTDLTSVVIGENVSSIGDEAFKDCTSLTEIVIPHSVTSIGKKAFYNCNGLKNVTFEDTSTWYRVDEYLDWQNKIGITEMSVEDTSANATYLKSTYYNDYWYKL